MELLVPTISIIVSVIGSVGTSAYVIWRQIHDYREEMRKDIKIQSQRSDDLYKQFYENTAKSTERTDKLYQMFIDLVKEGRK